MFTVKDVQTELEILLKLIESADSKLQAILIRAKAFAVVSFFSRVAIEKNRYQDSAEVLDMWGEWYLPQFEMVIESL